MQKKILGGRSQVKSLKSFLKKVVLPTLGTTFWPVRRFGR
jgi:hypothetical protein